MSQWYFQTAGDTIGPVSMEELQQRADDGQVQQDTEVRQGPDGPWVPAGEVPGLFSPRGGPDEVLELAAGSDASEAAQADQGDRGVSRSPLALRPCSDCGAMVSQQATMCPHCGRSFQAFSVDVPYRGEQPIPVMVFFAALAVAFLLLSPVIVHRLASYLLSADASGMVASGDAEGPAAGMRGVEADASRTAMALLITLGYTGTMIVCAALGGAAGAPRMAYFTGLLMGLFFGPLGVFAAFAIDKRTRCPNCFSRLNGPARECPQCHVGLQWKLERQWF